MPGCSRDIKDSMKEIKIDGLEPEGQEEKLDLITDMFEDEGEQPPRSRAARPKKAQPEEPKPARRSRKALPEKAEEPAPVRRSGKAWKDEEPEEPELPEWMDEINDRDNDAEPEDAAEDAPEDEEGAELPLWVEKPRREVAWRSETAAKKTGSGKTQARRTPPRRRRRRRRQGVLAPVLLVLLLVIAGVGFYAKGKLDLIQRLPWNRNQVRNENLSAETEELLKGFWTVAVFGVDSRDNTLGKGNNADVNILVNINHDTGEISLASVYRDTYMNIRDDDYNKINAAYMLGGPENAVQALNRNLDLQIEDYATFNWKAVADGINILGGIDVELTQEEFYYINAFIAETVDATGVPSTPLKAGGMQHLDGVQAVAYGRLRLMDSDYMRTERQRKVIQLAFEKMKQADLNTLKAIIGVVFPQVATSVDVQDMLYMASHVSRYHIGGTVGFPETRGERRMGKRGFCVVPRTLESNVKSLHAQFFHEYNYTPSDTVKSISDHLVEVSGMGEVEEEETAQQNP